MSFAISYHETGLSEGCDKCKAKEGPMLSITQRSGSGYNADHNEIFIHERCLVKAIETAKKLAER